MAKYETCILGLNMEIGMNIQELLVIGDSDLLVHYVQGMGHQEFQDIVIFAPHAGIEKEEETDGKTWFHDIKEYLAKGEYPEHTNYTKKRTLRILSNHFFHSGGNLYRRTPELGLLRYVDAKEAFKLLKEIYAGTCSPHMNGFVLAKKILKAGYFWMTMETDCIQYVRKCYQCQVKADMIKSAAK
ncbi:uncharacterized protein [Nicotiana sylvestris]|uniref:uncharacterized protein n=1 Tax=Nicotiana sylvestris TaxID=4096 RepID=UPI00388CB8B6